MYLAKRLEEHEREIEELERRLEEYRGLVSEKQIRIEESYLRLLKRLRLVAIERGPLGPRARRPFLEGYVEDWDFSTTNWQLDTTDYVSPPSSLYIKTRTYVLCKVSGTLCIISGRIVTYMKGPKSWGGSYYPCILFRNDSPVGSAQMNNLYRTQLNAQDKAIYLLRYEDGSFSRVAEASVYPEIVDAVILTEWNQFRVTWWTDPGGAGLLVRWEIFLNGEWQKIGDDLNDPLDYYSTTDTRRCGIGDDYLYGPAWFDDTEIWSA